MPFLPLPKLHPGDKVAIIEGLPGAFNGEQRRLGFEDAAKAANLKIVASQTAPRSPPTRPRLLPALALVVTAAAVLEPVRAAAAAADEAAATTAAAATTGTALAGPRGARAVSSGGPASPSRELFELIRLITCV